mmetsp:Transcript_33352/g.69838  ORF Transcript_33352/g.69838 Transcript_33352/m.69838 type:complete len:308 (-) Transcript_33352:166-1089(-)
MGDSRGNARRKGKKSDDVDLDEVDLEKGDPDSEGAGTGQQSAFMKDFFQKVDAVKKDMDAIKKNITDIEKKHGEALKATSKAVSSKTEDSLHKLMDTTSDLMQGVKNKLMSMKEDKDKAKKGDSEARVRENLHQTLSKKFVALSQEYQEIQTRYKEKYRERVGRQLKVVKPDATKAEIDALMESGGDKDIFTQTLLQQRSDQAAKNALADIQDKHKDIMRLEQSLVELHQLFIDMATLVESQGEMLDQIEYSVGQAQMYVDKGVQQLEKAKVSQKSARKRMCCLICCFAVILVVVLVVIFGGKFIQT